MKQTMAELRRRLGGWAVFAVAVVTLGSLFWITHTDQRRATCQARVNAAFSQVLTARGELADQDRTVTRTMVLTVAHATSRQQVAAALAAYADAEQKLDTERKEHPFPPLPARECGSP